jgi:hypothetical protein
MGFPVYMTQLPPKQKLAANQGRDREEEAR